MRKDWILILMVQLMTLLQAGSVKGVKNFF